ncbi:aminoglycoside phosphotransferase family protein [Streptomyces sp. Wb2n-11]|uniref:aminoglycoside phosphotransferase family protein n=1 Tax=Streptomyces sp. Wb2n-11 TaxID=1030533 RepID=UPI000AB5D6B0|nr:aminoglycoside phosphotransferase family protein [Streptomyces sp. Wb2n-11]
MCAVRTHADGADIDVSLVRRLVDGQFPQWAGLPVEPVVSSGTENAMYRLGEDMAVRLPRREGAAGDVEGEQRWLPRLAPHLPVAVPAPLAKGGPAEGCPWSWSVYRWLEGGNPVAGRVAEPGPLAGDLGKSVTALREIDPVGGPPSGRGVPLATRDAPTRAAIGEMHGIIDTEAATAAWEEALRIPERSGPAAWSHGDLSPGNVLADRGRLSAVIDFGVAGAGDPSVDLIVAWNLLPAEARGVFREALRADDATWARGRGRALSIAFIQLPHYRNTNPVLAAGARHVIREVFADHGYAARAGRGAGG